MSRLYVFLHSFLSRARTTQETEKYVYIYILLTKIKWLVATKNILQNQGHVAPLVSNKNTSALKNYMHVPKCRHIRS